MSRLSAISVAGVALMLGASARGTQGPPAPAGSAETRAVAYLVREVPRWRQEHPCYSCHNNGDAARALMAALERRPEVRPALEDTLAWLAEPPRWATNGGGEGGGDDKRLARIQFASATRAAAAASLVPRSALTAAAEIIASDQQVDGSWRLDSSNSLGSPASYGTALATASARRAVAASGLATVQDVVARADQWLQKVEPNNVPDAAAVVFALGDAIGDLARSRVTLAAEFLRRSQGRDGGWGPYPNASSEPFDTALALLALRSPAVAERGPAKETLAEALARGRDYLVRAQFDDGSWPETTRPARQTSYAQRISTTAWSLLALLEVP